MPSSAIIWRNWRRLLATGFTRYDKTDFGQSVVKVCNYSLLCCTLLYVHSSCAIIVMGKRELVALLSLSSWCHMIAVWLFLSVPWVFLQFVSVVFPDHTN